LYCEGLRPTYVIFGYLTAEVFPGFSLPQRKDNDPMTCINN